VKGILKLGYKQMRELARRFTAALEKAVSSIPAEFMHSDLAHLREPNVSAGGNSLSAYFSCRCSDVALIGQALARTFESEVTPIHVGNSTHLHGHAYSPETQLDALASHDDFRARRCGL
jgi:hypothetical protein